MKLSAEFLRLRPDPEVDPARYIYWSELLIATADTLFTRPNYEDVLTPAMRKWQDFVDNARYGLGIL